MKPKPHCYVIETGGGIVVASGFHSKKDAKAGVRRLVKMFRIRRCA